MIGLLIFLGQSSANQAVGRAGAKGGAKGRGGGDQREGGGDLHGAEQQRASPARAAGRGCHSHRPPVLLLGLSPLHAPGPLAVLPAHSTACTHQLGLSHLHSAACMQLLMLSNLHPPTHAWQLTLITSRFLVCTCHGDWQLSCGMRC